MQNLNSKEFLKTKLLLKNRGLTIDASSICTLECPMCRRQHYRDLGISPGQNGYDITPEIFLKLVEGYDWFDFCGQVSDPIFCVHLIDLLKIAYAKNKRVRVCTAATSKKHNRDWYVEAFTAHPGAAWTFGLDGMPDESCMYRINQDGEFLFDMMVLAKEMGLDVRWQYIVFSYNENNIESAYELSKKYNIEFELNITARFSKQDVYKPKNPKYVKERPAEWKTLDLI